MLLTQRFNEYGEMTNVTTRRNEELGAAFGRSQPVTGDRSHAEVAEMRKTGLLSGLCTSA